MSTRKLYRQRNSNKPGGRTLRSAMTSGRALGPTPPRLKKKTIRKDKPQHTPVPEGFDFKFKAPSKKRNTPSYKVPKTPKHSGKGWGY